MLACTNKRKEVKNVAKGFLRAPIPRRIDTLQVGDFAAAVKGRSMYALYLTGNMQTQSEKSEIRPASNFTPDRERVAG
jgi:hypothetical protein